MIEEKLTEYLYSGWRLSLKTHVALIKFIDKLEDWAPLGDGQHVIGWICDAYAFGEKRRVMGPNGYVHGGVYGSIKEAVEKTETRIAFLENSLYNVKEKAENSELGGFLYLYSQISF